jgi:hypothetical protein
MHHGHKSRGHVGVSQIGGVDQDMQQAAYSNNEQMRLTSVNFLGPIVIRAPPVPLDFTVCESILVAESSGGRLMQVRTSLQGWLWMRNLAQSGRQTQSIATLAASARGLLGWQQ